MDLLVRILVCLLAGYGFGNISTGYIVGRMNGIDIRESGSGNAGTTNALRTLGKKAGLITFVGDIMKAVIPIILVRVLIKNTDESYLLGLYTGLGVVLGHNFPFWLHFHGGKGIAVTSGTIIALGDWRIILVGLIAFVVVVAITRYVSVGSLIVACGLPINLLLFRRGHEMFTQALIVCIAYTVLAYIKHWSNIKRLMNGTENKLWGDKK